MPQPAVTIITAVYNMAEDLQETIRSVIANPYSNLKYIIIDGNSSDATVEIIKQHEHHLFYWCSEPDKGVYDAMNKGWQYAPDDSYILFLGAGDKLIHLPELTEQSPNIIFGFVQKGKHFLFNSTADLRLRLGNTVHHQALLIKKKLHPAPPFNLEYPVYADFDFNQRLLKLGHKFIKDKNFLSYAREAGISEQFKKDEMLKIVKKNFGSLWAKAARVYYALQKIYYSFKHVAHSKTNN